MSIDIKKRVNLNYMQNSFGMLPPPIESNKNEPQITFKNDSIMDLYNMMQARITDLVKNKPLPMIVPFANTTAAEENKTAQEAQPKKTPKNIRPSDEVFEQFMEYVFKDEGGFANHKKDPGGATNMGICKKWYDKVMGETTLEEFKNLTKEDAKNYYYKEYWIPSGASKLAKEGNEKLAYAVFDTAIHHGVGTAKKLLKNSNNSAELLTDNRLKYMKGLKVWQHWSKGLQARIDKVEDRLSYLA